MILRCALIAALPPTKAPRTAVAWIWFSFLFALAALSHFQDASDNDLFNKVITVFAVLCDEIQELRLTAENARPPSSTTPYNNHAPLFDVRSHPRRARNC